jgi:hypothetical protein
MTTEHYSRQARIEDKGIVVAVQGNDNTEVHDQVMQLYTKLKASLSEPRLEVTIEEVNATLEAFGDYPAAQGAEIRNALAKKLREYRDALRKKQREGAPEGRD